MGEHLKHLKGAIHLHTDLSHDGRLTLAQLSDFLKNKGYDYIAITEHSYDVDDKSMQKLAIEAEKLSTNGFIIIPGLEFRCSHDIDIMGLGVTKPCREESPEKIIDHIHDHGGVAIFAHPSYRDYPVDKKWIEKLDGAEIWNQIHDSRYIPESKSVERFNRLRKDNSNLKAFCGLDMHINSNFFYLSTTVSVQSEDRRDILTALKRGSFKSQSLFFNINSNAKITSIYYVYIYMFNYLIIFVRRIRDLIINE